MPLYEYECDACGKRFEVIQKFSDAPVETCNLCRTGPVRRLLSSPAIQFKGSGWYITDYAQKGKSGSAGAADGGTSAPPEKSGKADKPESAGEKKSDAASTASSPAPSPAPKS